MIGRKVGQTLTLMLINTAFLTNGLNAATPTEQYFSTQKLDQIAVNSTTDSGTFAIQTGQNAPADKNWNAYEQTIGNEKMMIFLPNIPVFTRLNDSWRSTIATNNKVEYWFMSPIPAMPGIQKEDLFPMFIDLHSKYPFQMMSSNITEDNGLPVLEITSLNKKTKKIEKTRVILTGENFYVAEMKYPKKQDGKIETAMFLESVHLLK